MDRQCYYLLFMLTSWVSSADRFIREELGVTDRLRFTSGLHQYYNCTIYNNRLVSNFKIGMYLHDHKTKIQFSINDTENYILRTTKLQTSVSIVLS